MELARDETAVGWILSTHWWTRVVSVWQTSDPSRTGSLDMN